MSQMNDMNETEEDLINCLSKLITSDKTQIKNNLACIRRLQEKVYVELNKNNPDLVPTEHVDDGVKVRAILKHLKEGNHVDGKTNNFAWSIYTISMGLKMKWY